MNKRREINNVIFQKTINKTSRFESMSGPLGQSDLVNNRKIIMTSNRLKAGKTQNVAQLFAPKWLANALVLLPGFTEPNRDDVIRADEILDNGIESVDQDQVQAARESMERARCFFNNYAYLVGLLGATVPGVLIEWLQSYFPDFQQLRIAHVGTGAAAIWITKNMMNEYDRRIEQLKEEETVYILLCEEQNQGCDTR